MSVINDIWAAIMGVIHGADTITLVLMAVAAIGAGFMTMELSSVLTTTVVAMIVFSILVFIRAVALQHANASDLWMSDWKAFEAMKAITLLAYGIIFAVVIAIVSTIRNTVFG